jgi:hypothetical protein
MMYPEKLSPNFWFNEVFAKPGQIDKPTQLQVYTASRFCFEVLEPIRAHIGKPIRLTDGSRTGNYGSPTSQHRMNTGIEPFPWCDFAADINFGGGNTYADRFEAIRFLAASNLPFSQAIWYPKTTHIHIGYESARLTYRQRIQYAMPDGSYPVATPADILELDSIHRKGGIQWT